jgi:hypothetical protein
MVADERGRVPCHVGEVGREAVGADEITLHGCREAGNDHRDVASPVDVAHRHGGPCATARHVEREQLTHPTVLLGEDLSRGAHGRELREGPLVCDAPASAAEGADGGGAGQDHGAVEEVVPRPRGGFVSGHPGDELNLRALQE